MLPTPNRVESYRDASRNSGKSRHGFCKQSYRPIEERATYKASVWGCQSNSGLDNILLGKHNKRCWLRFALTLVATTINQRRAKRTFSNMLNIPFWKVTAGLSVGLPGMFTKSRLFPMFRASSVAGNEPGAWLWKAMSTLLVKTSPELAWVFSCIPVSNEVPLVLARPQDEIAPQGCDQACFLQKGMWLVNFYRPRVLAGDPKWDWWEPGAWLMMAAQRKAVSLWHLGFHLPLLHRRLRSRDASILFNFSSSDSRLLLCAVFVPFFRYLWAGSHLWCISRK